MYNSLNFQCNFNLNFNSTHDMSFQFIKPASVTDMLVSSKLSNYLSGQRLTNVHEVCFLTDIIFTINEKV